MAAAATPNSSAKITTSASLTAVYSSSESTKTFAHPLPRLLSSPVTSLSTTAKTQYLSALRQSIPKLQDELNEFLTEKMEQDRKAAGTQDGDGTRVNHEASAEQNYGEEVPDEAEEG